MRAKCIGDRKFYVYKITNHVNGKVYIGKSNTAKNRWKDHLAIAERQSPKNSYSYLHKSINKYGKDNFTFEIIEYFNDETLAYAAEQRYVLLYRANEHIYGMNMNSGGLGGMRHTQEIKDKISAKRIGFKFSEESIEKMSKSHLGQRPTFANFTDQDVIEIRRKFHDMKLRKIKYIREILAKEYNASISSISFVLNGKNYKHIPIEILPELPQDLKACSKCNMIQSKINYSKCNKAKDGLMCRCKMCDRVTPRKQRKR